MKRSRPQSFSIGGYTVRQDAGADRRWRIFDLSGTCVWSTESQARAFEFANARGPLERARVIRRAAMQSTFTEAL